MLCQVQFRCGHQGILDLTGQAEERAHKAEWYAKHVICPDCRMQAAISKWNTTCQRSTAFPQPVSNYAHK